MLVLLREISLRHWLRSRVRSLLVVLGIALGVGLYVATEAASESMLSAFDQLVKRISGRADLSVRGTGLGVPSETAAELADVPGVAHAAAIIELSVQAPELAESLLVLGVDLLGDLHFLPFAVENGDHDAFFDPLSFVNDPTAILLSKQFAQRHGLHTGSRLRLLTADGPREFKLRGVLDDNGAAASFSGQVAVMFLDAAQIAFGRGTSVDRVDIAVAPGQSVEAVRKRIAARLGKQLHVEHPAQIGSRLKSLVGPLRAALWVSGFLALVVGGFLVYNAVAVALLQRRREVAIMRALGVTRAATIGLFVTEAALLALPGVALGLWLGSNLARYTVAQTLDTLNRIYAPVTQHGVGPLPWLMIAKALSAGLLLATLSAFFPARRGASLEPASVLAGAAAVQQGETPVRTMLLAALGVACLPWLPVFHHGKFGGVMQIVLILMSTTLATPAFILMVRASLVYGVERVFGIPGRLGLDYVVRTLGRSTVNVLALMVAVGMSVCVGGWLGSFERSLTHWARRVGTSDLTVTRGSPVVDRQHLPLSPETTARVRAVPGVAAVQRFRSLEQQVGEATFHLIATDTDTFIAYSRQRGKGWEFVEGGPLPAGALMQRPSIVLSENGARLLRVKVGDLLNLATPKGEVKFLVRAVVIDYTSELGTGYIDIRYFHEFWSDTSADALFVYLANDVTAETAAQRIRAAMGGGADHAAVFVLKASAMEQHVVDMLHQTFSYSRSIETMTLIIALLGVVGTMLAAVMDRRRDMGTLRAIGATRGQVACAIVVEAGFLGLCAALAGILVGVVECRVFFETLLLSQTGWHLDFVFPWAAAARTAGFVVFTSALAGALPAWRATRGDIVVSAVAD